MDGCYLCWVEDFDWLGTASCSSGEEERREVGVEEGEHCEGGTRILEKRGEVVTDHGFFGLCNWTWW